MKSQEKETYRSPLEILTEYLRKTSPEELKTIFDEFDKKQYEGCTVEEYLDYFKSLDPSPKTHNITRDELTLFVITGRLNIDQKITWMDRFKEGDTINVLEANGTTTVLKAVLSLILEHA